MTSIPSHLNVDAAAFYRARRERHSTALAQARQSSAFFSNSRTYTFFGTFALMAVLGYFGFYLFGAIALLIGVFLFAILVHRHNQIERAIVLEEHLLAINSDGEARLTGKWKDFPDRGEEFMNEKHRNANDLDLFGRASLFQWICAAKTRYGRERLAEGLKSPAAEKSEITERQGMIRELAGMADWRQSFQAAGMDVAKKKEDPDGLIGWAESDMGLTFTPIMTMVLRAWGVIGAASLVIFGLLIPNPALAALPLILNAIVVSRFQSRTNPVIATLCFQKKNLESYVAMLREIETAKFTDPGLMALVTHIHHGPIPASKQAKELLSIVEWLDIRLNPIVHTALNYVFLWDLQCLTFFQVWKKRSGNVLRIWLQGIGALEALASLSILRFENPSWAFPTLAEGEPSKFVAKGLGHPLILARDRVYNDFQLIQQSGSGSGVVLTGSNMTGKSTWLRTVGLNMVMAQVGAPVCAQTMETSLFHIHTSMRLKDDLDQGVSSFYAELIRIRAILDEARQKTRVFFLVDEIFRGTNSVDRIAGATEVLLQLVRLGSSGLVSTHDLELGQLAYDQPQLFRNCHFSKRFENGEIHFDFKLHEGISTTRTAIHLMRLAGVTEPSQKS